MLMIPAGHCLVYMMMSGTGRKNTLCNSEAGFIVIKVVYQNTYTQHKLACDSVRIQKVFII